MKYHIITVSDQLIPNVLPVLNDVQQGEECTVVICASKKMKGKAELCQNFFQEKGIAVHWDKKDVPGNDWGVLYRYFTKVRESVVDKMPDRIVVNLTGGTKLMAFAMYSAFSKEKEKVDFVYVDTPADASPKCLYPFSSKNPQKFPPALLRVKDFLSLYGKQVKVTEEGDNSISDADRSFFEALLKYAQEKYAREKYAQENGEMNEERKMNEEIMGWCQKNRKPPEELVKLFREHKRVRYRYDGGGSWTELPKDDQKYLIGGWFEAYAYDILDKNRKKWDISDLAINVKYDGRETNNEVDIAFVRHNRLFIVECKSGGKSQENISYKFKDIRNELGLACRGWFVSLQGFKDGERARLEEAEKCDVCVVVKEKDLATWIDKQFNNKQAGS